MKQLMLKHSSYFWRTLLILALMTGLSKVVHAQETQIVRSVDHLEISKYMGTWYEIAKFPNWFQRKCARNTQATYRLLGSQQIEVLNQCVTAGDERIQAVGLARPRANGLPAQLEVRFAPSWLGWLPFTWGDYWVLDLDADYQLAAVGDPSRNYLWILSRAPQLSASAYSALTQRLTLMGFDIKRLEKTPQK
jgi:apolipoprotein D and lipocalin family protein